MKNAFSLAILLFAALSAYPSNRDGIGYEKYLNKLDECILQKDKYEKQKEDRISMLLDRLKDGSLSLDEQYRYTYLLFDEYSTYESKSMYTCALQLIDISKELGDKNRLVESEVCLGYSHLWRGAFKETYEYITQIDTTGTSKNTQANYLMLLLNLEYESGLYVKPLRSFFKSYEAKMLHIISKLEGLVPPSDDRLIEAKQKECFHSDKFQQAYEYLTTRLEKSSGVSRQMSAKLGDLGFMNLEMGDTITAVQYMVESAIMDIQIGSRQAPALRKIAEAIYPHDEINRAYKYIQLSMDNAVSFDSRYRMYESSIMLPTIDKDLYELTKKQKDTLLVAVCIIIISVIALLISLGFIWKQNKKLTSSGLLIKQQNDSLLSINDRIKQINKELLETNTIKEAYLGRILSSNSAVITRIENLVQVVNRKMKAKQYEDITNFIYKNDYLKERKEMLDRFDKMFLQLFPNFIDAFNALLKEEDKMIVDENGGLTPELRIFALIRLGVTKSDTIADILNYSSSTVRNYKTKIRNISIVPNDEFDKKIMKIESGYAV